MAGSWPPQISVWRAGAGTSATLFSCGPMWVDQTLLPILPYFIVFLGPNLSLYVCVRACMRVCLGRTFSCFLKFIGTISMKRKNICLWPWLINNCSIWSVVSVEVLVSCHLASFSNKYCFYVYYDLTDQIQLHSNCGHEGCEYPVLRPTRFCWHSVC